MIATLVAVIAPLLLLLGLKHGVVSSMQDELARDPRNLEIRMLSSGSYDQAWVDELARRPGAGFVVGMTRSLNTQADFIAPRPDSSRTSKCCLRPQAIPCWLAWTCRHWAAWAWY